MHPFCIWTCALKTSVGQLRALSSELMVGGCFSENTALSHRWVLENVLPEMRPKEASHLLCMSSLWHQAAFWFSGTRVFNPHEPLCWCCSFCLSVNRRKQLKTQRQILQGLSICIRLLCLGKVAIYKGSGAVKKWGILCEGEDVLGLKEGLICGYYYCLWSANRDLKLIHQSSTSLIYSARWRCQNRLLLLSLTLHYHEVVEQVVQSKASKGWERVRCRNAAGCVKWLRVVKATAGSISHSQHYPNLMGGWRTQPQREVGWHTELNITGYFHAKLREQKMQAPCISKVIP